MKIKTGYYYADTANGVTFYGELMEDPNADIMKATDFYDSLDTLDDGEIIFTFIGPEDACIIGKIEEEYGIH